MNNELTQAKLKKLLEYNSETGEFRWRMRPCNRVVVGDTAGSLNDQGYRWIKVCRKSYVAHRLAWLYVHGEWPDGQIDHINGQRDDNPIANLRIAKNQAEQMQNQSIHPLNTSGYPGVCWHKQLQKWQAYINVNGKRRHLGLFDELETAAHAYWEAKQKHHKFCPQVRGFSYHQTG